MDPSARPITRYARVDADHVAYQVIGEGPLVVVFVPEGTSHLEVQWEDPASAHFLHRLASFARIVMFDKRGVGLSDPLPPDQGAGLDPWMDDMNAVLDAADCDRVALVGTGAGGPMTMLYAASHPERTSALVCCNSAARFVQAPDYPIGIDPGIVDEAVQWTRATWGTGAMFATGAPSLAESKDAQELHARMQRLSASPGAAASLQRIALAIDTRAILPTIQVPTLVLHRTGDRLVVQRHSRDLADHIPDAKFIELDGDDHLYYSGDDAMLRETRSFLTGSAVEIEPD